MDKVKIYLAVLKKHHFWLLVVVAVLLATYGWYAGTKALDTEFASNKSAIDGAFSGVRAIKKGDPNPSFKEKTDALHEQQKQKVFVAWQKLYERQRANLKWPEVVKQIANLPVKAPISGQVREAFWQYFRLEFPELFKRVEPFEQIPDEGGAVAAGEKEARFRGIVDWSSADRDALVNRYSWGSTPTTQQVRLAQEDYWIYQSLLDIIAAVNKQAGATSPANAAITRIELLKIAQEAFDSGIPAIEGLANAAFPPSGDTSAQQKLPTAASLDDELLRNRYVGFDGKPLETAEENAVFKLIPVRMRLVMDQRRIPDFLVACANSPLPVEVRHVRYNPGSTSGRGAIGSGEAPSGGSLGPRPQMSMPGSGGSGTFGAPAARASAAKPAEAPVDVYSNTVEFRGVIYFFTAPNKELLGGGSGETEEASAGEETTAGATTDEPAATDTSNDAGEATQPEPTEPAPATDAAGEGTAAGEASPTTEPATEPAADSGTTEPGAATETPAEPAADAAPAEPPTETP
ncbi:MAG: hypothetical protein K2Y37_03725 [Pirellulales bacterium]|nr:hypothetical protein [Pirellulales bacterium]